MHPPLHIRIAGARQAHCGGCRFSRQLFQPIGRHSGHISNEFRPGALPLRGCCWKGNGVPCWCFLASGPWSLPRPDDPAPVRRGAARGAGGGGHSVAVLLPPAASGDHATPAGRSRSFGLGRRAVIPSPAVDPSRLTSGGTISNGPPPAPVTPGTSTPPSMVGSPAPQAPAIAPLSPSLPTQFSTGGGSPGASNLALSPGPSSESSPKRAGRRRQHPGRLHGFLGQATHMSKTEWRSACKRTLEEFPTVLR